MNTQIKVLKLVVSPGYPRTFIEITTLNQAGVDVGYRGVLAEGKQYRASFDIFQKFPDGREIHGRIVGNGGTEPKWNGKPREEKTGDDHYPDPGTGAADGFQLAPELEDINVGGEAYQYDLGFRGPLNHKNSKDCTLTIQGHVEGIGSTQSVVCEIKDGRLRKLAD